MGLFNLFGGKVDTLEEYLLSIQSQIQELPEFKNLNLSLESHQFELKEFKKFIITTLSGCLYLLKVKQHLNIEDFKSTDPIFQKIFQTTFRQNITFYKSYVQNDKIIIGLFDNSRLKNDNMFLFDMFLRFGKYEKEIKEGFETGNTYFFEEFEKEEYDEEFNIQITGRKIYFEYIKLLFLTKIDNTEDNKLKVGQLELWELDNDVFDTLGSFVKSISNIFKNIEVRTQMLS